MSPRAGRPVGHPPFKWEVSASDALVFDGLSTWTNWSLPGTLFVLERFNGFGYRGPDIHILTPYLWSFSNHYTKGKFVRDNVFSPTAVSKQCGAAVLLRQHGLAQAGEDRGSADGSPSSRRSHCDHACGHAFPFHRRARSTRTSSSASEQVMLRKFGKPGALTATCSSPTGLFVSRIKFGVDVGPFKVSGLDFAVESLRQIFAEVEAKARPVSSTR